MPVAAGLVSALLETMLQLLSLPVLQAQGRSARRSTPASNGTPPLGVLLPQLACTTQACHLKTSLLSALSPQTATLAKQTFLANWKQNNSRPCGKREMCLTGPGLWLHPHLTLEHGCLLLPPGHWVSTSRAASLLLPPFSESVATYSEEMPGAPGATKLLHDDATMELGVGEEATSQLAIMVFATIASSGASPQAWTPSEKCQASFPLTPDGDQLMSSYRHARGKGLSLWTLRLHARSAKTWPVILLTATWQQPWTTKRTSSRTGKQGTAVPSLASRWSQWWPKPLGAGALQRRTCSGSLHAPRLRPLA